MARNDVDNFESIFCFCFQHDGNLVLYRNSDNHPLWATATHASGAIKAVMQADGNLGTRFHFNIVR